MLGFMEPKTKKNIDYSDSQTAKCYTKTKLVFETLFDFVY